MKYITLIFLLISESSVYCRLVFKPGSDVGYILPDPVEDEPDNSSKNIVTKFIEDREIKNEVKRAFWNSVFDSSNNGNYGASELVRREEQSLNDIPENLKDDKHGVAMGIADHRCDDAKTALETDWDGSPVNHTCYTPKRRLYVRSDLSPLETCDPVPPGYIPKHYCMSHNIHYNSSIPTYGPHRPLWAVFGEYRFLPPQRWLHNVEHGSVIMLYHPCAEPLLVMRLKEIIRKCVYKHVISPSTLTSLERPMVLVAWGCKLEMATVDEEKVVSFVRERALKGPEGIYTKQGTFTRGLLHKSTPPAGSDISDSILCPNF